METTIPSSLRHAGAPYPTSGEASVSGVSWAAIAAGAFVAAALALILLALGSGLGFSSISPWANSGASAATIGAVAIAWLIIMQIISSSLGGYIAGRLRTKWVGVHNDEVFFRDTAHGFLAWAVGVVVSAALLASAAGTLIGGAVEAGGAVATTAAAAGVGAASQTDKTGNDLTAYFSDSLMRTDRPDAAPANAATGEEVKRILTNGMRQKDLPAADRTYLAKLVAARTGLSEAEANKRVDDTVAQIKNAEMEARQAADTARKAAAHLSLWIFLSLLIGAFCASYAATIGGRQRDYITV